VKQTGMQDLATQTLVENKCLEKSTLFNSLTKSCLHWPYKKSHDPLYTTAATKKSCLGKMPYMISSQSVTDGVSLSVSKSKLVYSSLIFLEN